MYLAQWILTPKEYQLLGAYNNYKMHQLVTEIFDQSGVAKEERKSVRFDITKNEGNVIILIQCDINYTNHPIYGNLWFHFQ